MGGVLRRERRETGNHGEVVAMSEHESNGSAPVRLEIEGATARITLAAPARRNALSPRMLRLLLDAFDQAMDVAEVRAIVLAADGSAFCAGADLETADDAEMPRLFAAVL